MLKVFLDTEFTRLPPPISEGYRAQPRLISLALVSEDGREVYVEVAGGWSVNDCSDFVKREVLPLLGKHPEAICRVEDLGPRIMEWLECVKGNDEGVEVCFDFQTDWDLIVGAVNHRLPPWCKPRNVSRNINKLLRYAYHKTNELPEHHALYDAQAARHAFRERPPVST